MSYDEKRTILRELGVHVTLFKKDAPDRFIMEWSLPIAEDWWIPDETDLGEWEDVPGIPGAIYSKNEQPANGNDLSIQALAKRVCWNGIAEG